MDRTPLTENELSGYLDRFRRETAQAWEELETRVKSVARSREEGEELARLSCRHLTDRLNGAIRRLQSAESGEIWNRVVLDAAGEFAAVVGLFRLHGSILQFAGSRGLPEPPIAIAVTLASAPAFAEALDSRDTIIAAATEAELSPDVASWLSAAGDARVYLFPIAARDKAAGVLCVKAETGIIDVSGLELLASMAAYSAEALRAAPAPEPAKLVLISPAEPAGTASRPSWSKLPKSEQEIHLRAQRFARTKLSELLLHKMEQVRTGRTSQNLYGALKEEIETAREDFREQFVAACPSMVDYLHLELVRTLAKDDESALGADYPGPLSH